MRTGEGMMWDAYRGQANDVQINESRSPLLFSILHGEGNEKAGEGANKLPLEIIVNFL